MHVQVVLDAPVGPDDANDLRGVLRAQADPADGAVHQDIPARRAGVDLDTGPVACGGAARIDELDLEAAARAAARIPQHAYERVGADACEIEIAVAIEIHGDRARGSEPEQ